jgi:DNA repair exonuclease SbcCD ATPase subunit
MQCVTNQLKLVIGIFLLFNVCSCVTVEGFLLFFYLQNIQRRSSSMARISVTLSDTHDDDDDDDVSDASALAPITAADANYSTESILVALGAGSDSNFLEVAAALQAITANKTALKNSLTKAKDVVQISQAHHQSSMQRLQTHRLTVQQSKNEIDRLKQLLEQLELKERELQQQTTIMEEEMLSAQEQVATAEAQRQRVQKSLEQMELSIRESHQSIDKAKQDYNAWLSKVSRVSFDLT